MPNNTAIRRSAALLGATVVATASLAALAAGSANAATAPKPDVWSTDTGWVTNYDGGCAIKAHVDYYPSSDKAYIQTTIQSPYLFAACRAHTQLWVQTSGNVFAGAVQSSMACGVTDTSCSSTKTYTDTYAGQTPGLTAYVSSVNDGLEAAGLPRSYTAKQAVTGISVSFSKA